MTEWPNNHASSSSSRIFDGLRPDACTQDVARGDAANMRDIEGAYAA
jgi:hypothetical protein